MQHLRLYNTSSLPRFLALADCPHWTVLMDAVLIHALNEYSDKKMMSVWNLSIDACLSARKFVKSELLVLAQEADYAAGTRR